MAEKQRKGVAIAAGVCGIIELICGLCIAICCGVFAAKVSGVVNPFWSGIPLMFLGGFGIGTAVIRNNCMMIAYLILSIIICLITFISSALTAIAAALFSLATKYLSHSGCHSYGKNCFCQKDGGGYETYNDINCDNLKAIHTLLQAITAFAVIGGLACLASSIVGCAGVCCYKPEKKNAIVVSSQGQAVVISGGQAQPSNAGMIMYQPPQGHQPPPPLYTDPTLPTKPGFVHVE